MQDPQFYQRLGACINLAIAGSTEGERSSGKAAAKRLVAKLTPAEQQVLLHALPSVKSPPKTVNRKLGTKRAQIEELLRRGFTPKEVAGKVHTKVQYVYHVKHDMGPSH